MNLTDIIQNYELGQVIHVEQALLGSGSTYFIQTPGKKYVAKTGQRQDFLKIYQKVQAHLNAKNILQGRLVRTRDNQLQTADGLAVYEYISGDCWKTLTAAQTDRAINYMYIYNQALKEVAFSETELETRNNWDRARSLEFLGRELPQLLTQAVPARLRQTVLSAARVILGKHQLLSASRQLIHGDPGPDNFLFHGDEVRCMLDFTPDYQHELYSLCQFVYWNNLWTARAIPGDLNRCLCQYYPEREGLDYIDLFSVLLLQAALYRVTGPLLDILEAGHENWAGLEKRVCILEEVQKYVMASYTLGFHQQN